jgi:uncharacterized YigZ family protein
MSEPPPEQYRTLAAPLRHEIERIKGSRFIAEVAPVVSPDQALARVEALRREFHDARHHCWAYRLGAGGDRFRFNDDGEPSGSAGRPILQQIDGRELTDVVAVVVRYFGGTKLGVGGLVRAYGGAAGAALDHAGIRTVTVTEEVAVAYPYEVSGEVQRLLTASDLRPASADYGETIRLVLRVPIRDVDGWVARLRDVTAGRATVEVARPDAEAPDTPDAG